MPPPPKTIHLVYHHGQRISHPDSLGRNIGRRLSKQYQVQQYDWNEFRCLQPGPNDVLLGHACHLPFTLFRRSCRQKGWKRVILMSPYCHGDPHQAAFNQQVIQRCDLYLAITGHYWFDDISNSLYSHWLPKMRHLDLAIDRADFPPIKTKFNESGQRRFLYIGKKAWYKNIGYLSEIACQLPQQKFAWIGQGRDIPGVESLGYQDFTVRETRELVKSFDFLLTVGKADGNPTTILESMGWGLIPVCTPQSGYANQPGIFNIPLGDARKAAELLNTLQQLPEENLKDLQVSNWKLLDQHYNWERFTSQVISAIESTESPDCLALSARKRWEIFLAELTNPYWFHEFNPMTLPQRILRQVRLASSHD
jgi:glycosyltransferase involved in cell wall biosynthesis